MEKKKPRKDTLIKLQRRKGKFREQVMRDKDLPGAHRCCLWFAADCMTMTDTALHFEETKSVVIKPSQKGLAIRAGVSHNTANSAIKNAIKEGHLQMLFKGSGMVGNSEYRVMLKPSEQRTK